MYRILTPRNVSIFLLTVHVPILNDNSKHSLQITASTLRSLSLFRLEDIQSGTVKLQWNEQLCYVEKEMFQQLLGDDRKVTLERNMDPERCGKYQQTNPHKPQPLYPLSMLI